MSESVARLNIACGGTYVESWTNLDFNPVSPRVMRANLLSSLPFDDAAMEVVYSSHFVEHIPRKRMRYFLAECFRVLVPGGHIRLVTPDLQLLCREYLTRRDGGDHEKADFVIVELLDQCVRQQSGGELGNLYECLSQNGTEKLELRDYVEEMTGQQLFNAGRSTNISAWRTKVIKGWRHPNKILSWLLPKYCYLVSYLFPPAFRDQNVCFAEIGERHMWLYDSYTLGRLLEESGFKEVRKLTFDRTDIPSFPLVPLDATVDGKPRKGLESMYIEARKPTA